ncbi:MAG: hypothetical protein PVF58_12510 [Candidatus Methanofastidiosia archaeon]|jgi:hypothetical protein
MHYFDEVLLEPQLYLLEGDRDLLMEFTSYILVKKAPSVVLDGGNSFNPFTISFFCRKLGVDAMENVFVSRAFTVFQLKALITQELSAAIQEINPSVVVISFFNDLFYSDDVDKEVATILHKKLLLRLKQMVTTCGIPILVTTRKSKYNFPCSVCDCTISLRMNSKSFVLFIDQKKLQFPVVPPHQKTLDPWRRYHG